MKVEINHLTKVIQGKAFAFSLGKICSRWQLLSTIRIIAVSSSISRTMQGIVSTPARWLA